MGLVLPLRFYANFQVIRELAADDFQAKSIYRLPLREFKADMLAWLTIGGLMAALYLIYFKSPMSTGIKMLIACLSFGLFGGMLSFLSTENRILTRFKTTKAAGTFMPEKMLPVSRKTLFFMITVLLFTVIVILLMFFFDINYILNNKDFLGPDIYMSVFKEIFFTFVVLLTISIIIVRRYSQNLKNVLAIQVQVMEGVGDGQYDDQVPVVSNDEFGVIAAKTNFMIQGLKERDVCQDSFGKYVTPEVSEKILKGEIAPEGELSQVTILFCDLRGYTTFVERQDPKDVVKFLNAYFTEMEHTIRQHNGIVLQYIGDEIEAVFGAPIPEPDHPAKAVMAALEMRERLEDLNLKLKAAGEDPANHGIGIHTGMVLAGSVGSPERLVYAMVGDTVNLASRIQNLNKKYHTDILISRTTKELLPEEKYETVSLGQTAVRGKREEVEIFRVV